MEFETHKAHQSFSGKTLFCSHFSKSCQTKMNFSCFLPKEIGEVKNALIWLSGLTCNEENFITKSGVQHYLTESDTMVICPDTSPRGLNIEGEEASYDFGSGAGFYVNATQSPFDKNYQMYDYIKNDIIELLTNSFKISKFGIFGHSMGGHGALVLGLTNPEIFTSVSSFSPIVNPIKCPWGKKAFKGYLGTDQNSWKKYDACQLLDQGSKHAQQILVDQGLADEFLEKELLTGNLEEAAKRAGQALLVNYRESFDHSYYFISSFIEGHINFHQQSLMQS